MTKEERAQIARENGAKSRGPKTEAGKQKSARNALKTGEHAFKYAHFLPPHVAAACTEDRAEYQKLVEDLIATYQPNSPDALNIVGDIAYSRLQIQRLKTHATNNWNLAYIRASDKPAGIIKDELQELRIMDDATAELFAPGAPLARINREIVRLQQIIKSAVRELKFLRDHFPPAQPEKRTEPKPEPSVENTGVNPSQPENMDDIPEPIFTYEHSQIVIASYRKQFPGRAIVIMPPENEPVPKNGNLHH